MSANTRTYWACNVSRKHLDATTRLAVACDLARTRLGTEPTRVYLHPLTAEETAAPDGVELIPLPGIQRWDYLFAREGQSPDEHNPDSADPETVAVGESAVPAMRTAVPDGGEWPEPWLAPLLSPLFHAADGQATATVVA